MKKIVWALIGAFVLAGCNTMAGFGEDTQAAGKKLEQTADQHQHYRP